MLEKLTLVFGTLIGTNINQVYIALQQNKVVFIDAITGKSKTREYINVYTFNLRQSFVFLDSPFSIEELVKSANSEVGHIKIDIVIVDSLCNGELGLNETEHLLKEAINSSLTFGV